MSQVGKVMTTQQTSSEVAQLVMALAELEPVSRPLILSKDPNLLLSSALLFAKILQQLLSELSSPEPKAISS